jgi:hypothetical protein
MTQTACPNTKSARYASPRLDPSEAVRPKRKTELIPRHVYNCGLAVLFFYVVLYVIGMLIGLAAKIALDMQLRRPGTRQMVGLVILALLLWGAISITHTPFTDVLLPLVWAGTGLLAGLGSRELHTAS